MMAPVRNYRDVTTAPIATAPIVHELAALALLALAGDGREDSSGPMPGDSTWRLAAQTRRGTELTVSCSGPDLPSYLPDETIRPADVGKQIPWAGVYRLVVRAPLTVFDLYWKPEEPLRILQFSRGDWEDDLRRLA
ncbi:MAG: hypothetical protein KDJ29_10305 [Hyphomicrobiales bacterium]|nr:hypothetical protein [Hyphomicrobiales bacterium]